MVEGGGFGSTKTQIPIIRLRQGYGGQAKETSITNNQGDMIMNARNGKIARLPAEVRREVNERLFDGQTGRSVARWLNTLPEVRTVMERDFEGANVTEDNVSQWRQGGYAEWMGQREFMDRARESEGFASEMSEAAGDLAENLLPVVTARYGILLAGWDGEPSEELEQKLKFLSRLSRWVIALQKAGHGKQRLAMEKVRHEWVEFDRDVKWEEKMSDLKSRKDALDFARNYARQVGKGEEKRLKEEKKAAAAEAKQAESGPKYVLETRANRTKSDQI
jgi:hypothetical protein